MLQQAGGTSRALLQGIILRVSSLLRCRTSFHACDSIFSVGAATVGDRRRCTSQQCALLRLAAGDYTPSRPVVAE